MAATHLGLRLFNDNYRRLRRRLVPSADELRAYGQVKGRFGDACGGRLWLTSYVFCQSRFSPQPEYQSGRQPLRDRPSADKPAAVRRMCNTLAFAKP